MIKILLICISFILAIPVHHEIYPKKILIGTPITIISKIDIDTSLKFEPIFDKNLYDTIILDSLYKNNNNIIQKITLWDFGNFDLPNLEIIVLNKKGNLDTINIDNVTIAVDSTLINNNSIKMNKSLVSIASNNNIKFFGYILIIIFLLVLTFFIANRDSKINEQDEKILIYNKKRAISDIDELSINIELNDSIREYYVNISIILRKYLMCKYFINATKMTSLEILEYFKKININPLLIKKINIILKELDISKYSNKKYNHIKIIDNKKIIIEIINELDKL